MNPGQEAHARCQTVVRIAALGDLHHGRTAAAGSLQPLFTQISEEADILVLCGDLTDYGLPEEARSLVRELAPLKIPIRRSARQSRLRVRTSRGGRARSWWTPGSTMLDGDTTEIQGIGFAGIKGFAGGFGRRALGPWGEDIIKQFVHEAVDEALKLETALARLRTERLIAVLHYSPIQATVEGEPLRDLPVPRLQPPRGAADALSGHRGLPRPRAPRPPEGTTRTGVPVFNVSMLADARVVPRASVPDRRGPDAHCTLSMLRAPQPRRRWSQVPDAYPVDRRACPNRRAAVGRRAETRCQASQDTGRHQAGGEEARAAATCCRSR